MLNDTFVKKSNPLTDWSNLDHAGLSCPDGQFVYGLNVTWTDVAPSEQCDTKVYDMCYGPNWTGTNPYCCPKGSLCFRVSNHIPAFQCQPVDIQYDRHLKTQCKGQLEGISGELHDVEVACYFNDQCHAISCPHNSKKDCSLRTMSSTEP